MKFHWRYFSSPSTFIAGVPVQPGLPNLEGGLPVVVSASAEQPASARVRPLSVCHLSPVNGRLDTRTYNLQILPALKHGVRAALVAPHGVEEPGGAELPPASGYRNRLLRFFNSPAIAFAASNHPAQLFHLHNPEMIPAGLLLKVIFRKVVVYDTQEDFPAMMLTKSYLPQKIRPLAAKLVAFAERLAAHLFDGFMTADPNTLRAVAHSGRSRKLVFYNLPNLEFFSRLPPSPKRFDVVYRGGLSERAGTFVLLDALQQLRHRGILAQALMFGYTDDNKTRSALLERIERMELAPQVVLHGRVPHDDMARTLAQARISISPLTAIPKFMHNIPVKVFESWACGLPVISSDLPPIRPFFRDGEYGLLVPPGDGQALADAIETLLRNPARAAAMGRAGRQAVFERCNNNREIHKLLSFYSRILGAAPRPAPAAAA